MKGFLNASEIAKLEHVTSMTVQRWARNGVFLGVRKVGREYRIPLESYHKWRESTKIDKKDKK